MPSRKEISITIKGNLSTGGGESIAYSKSGSAVATAISSDETANKETGKHTKATQGKQGKSGVKVLALYAYRSFANNLMATASQAWNRYVNIKEDYLAQNNMNAIKANLSAIKGYATSAVTGAQIGSVAGPVGAAIGAAIGVSANAVSRVVNYGVTIANYNEQNNAMNAQTNYSRVRMGLMDGGRGTEN